LNLYYKILLYILALLPYVFSLPLDVIDIDTAQYAEIAREMVETGDYFHLKDNGKKYLDKPILTFWTIAAFYKLFGISEFSFRLPALLALLIGSFSVGYTTFLISGNQYRGYLASLIYISIPGTFSIVLNPLIDIYLCMYLNLVHLTYYLGMKKNSKWYYLMYWFIGMGFITKGPISAVIPAISIGGDILFRRDWNRLKEIKLWIGIPIALVLPLFWSYLLLEEYSVYGPYFFFWQQSFGRFYDKMYNQKFDPFYFYKTLLWGLFPISGFLLYLIYKNISLFFKTNKPFFQTITNKWKNDWRERDFVIGFWIFLFIFLISFSRFQLPQYTYWVLGGGCIFLAQNLSYFTERNFSLWKKLFFYFPSIVLLSFVFISPFIIIDTNIFYWLTSVLVLGIGIILFLKTKEIVLINLIPMYSAMLVISLFIFPELLKYQPSKQIGKIIQELEPGKSFFYSFGLSHSKRSYEFYSKRLMRNLFDKSQLEQELKTGEFRLVVTPMEYYSFLIEKVQGSFKYEIIEDKLSYKIATPTQKFLKKKTRQNAVSHIYLVKLTKL